MEWIGWVLTVVAVTVVFDTVCMVVLLRAHRNHSDDSI